MAKVSPRGGRERKVRKCIWKGWPLVSESMKEWKLRIERRGEERDQKETGRRRAIQRQGWERSMRRIN